jgi:transglutaminase-like putative cysteine protease
MLRPSRYAPSDRVAGLTAAQFGDVAPGAARALAIADWIHDGVDYVSGSTAAHDSALETVLTRQGVCRDFAHLGVAFARALEIPARYASVYAPLLDPPDFHAVLEVHLGGAWWVLDPTRMAPRGTLVRIGTGRDAADCAFATIVGGRVEGQAVEVAAHTLGTPPGDDHQDLVRPTPDR